MAKILLLAGDGIGVEIMAQTKRLIEWFKQYTNFDIEIEEDFVGGCAYDAYGIPCADSTLEKAHSADAILLGAVGGHKWDNLPFEKKPERGLLRLRKELDLFANLRPAICFEALADSSTLKKDIISGLDILIVRELTGGVYFGEPRGIKTLADGTREGVDTQIYHTEEVRRIARVAFDLARKRAGQGKPKVVSAEKSNVMHSGILWREEVTYVHENENYKDIELTHMYADNAAMQLVRNPKQFDVMVTDNLFGDILSDAAAMLTGSLGMLPSASLGAIDEKTGKRNALYEPVHGSAPDIAGQNIANPIAMMMSFAMCLRYSFTKTIEADMLETAIKQVLKSCIRTKDIASKDEKYVSTTQMGDAVLNVLNELKQKQSA